MSSLLNQYREAYRRSGLDTPFERYLYLGAAVVVGVYVLSLLLFTGVHLAILRVEAIRAVVGSAAISVVPASIAAFAVLYYPQHKQGQDKNKIDNNLIYTVSYMTVLSTSGLSIERIIENITRIEEKGPMKKLGTKFIADLRLLGIDLNTALRSLGERSPSPAFTSLIDGINNVQRTSGDLKSLLSFNYDRYLQEKRKQLARMLNTLTYVGEAYVTLLVVAPIMFIFMLTIFTIIGSAADPAGQALQLNLLVFFAMPLFAGGFLIVLDTVLGVED